jgi:hypothetical protein
MTEDAPPAEVSAPLPAPDEPQDGLLELLASLAGTGAVTEYGITLYVQGLLVTGDLISRERWLSEWVEAERAVATDGDRTLSAILQKTLGWSADPEPDEDEEPRRYGYIHLRRAQVAHPSGFMPTDANGASLWRGRLSQISAWHVGRLGSGA